MTVLQVPWRHRECSEKLNIQGNWMGLGAQEGLSQGVVTLKLRSEIRCEARVAVGRKWEGDAKGGGGQ